MPGAVAEELSRSTTPMKVRNWLAEKPDWLQIRVPSSPIEAVSARHRGEREAICLACELHADLLLVDDRKARLDAQRLNLRTIGSLGVIERAAEAGLLELREVFDQIRKTDFHVTDDLLEQVLTRFERRGR